MGQRDADDPAGGRAAGAGSARCGRRGAHRWHQRAGVAVGRRGACGAGGRAGHVSRSLVRGPCAHRRLLGAAAVGLAQRLRHAAHADPVAAGRVDGHGAAAGRAAVAVPEDRAECRRQLAGFPAQPGGQPHARPLDDRGAGRRCGDLRRSRSAALAAARELRRGDRTAAGELAGHRRIHLHPARSRGCHRLLRQHAAGRHARLARAAHAGGRLGHGRARFVRLRYRNASMRCWRACCRATMPARRRCSRC